jgi:hypothetical protein
MQDFADERHGTGMIIPISSYAVQGEIRVV